MSGWLTSMLISIGLCFSSLPVSTAQDESEAVPPAVRVVYFERCLFVEAREGGGEALWFLLDTGANRSAIDQTTAERLGLETVEATKVEGTTGVIETEIVRLPSLTVGGQVVKDLSPTAQDLSGCLRPPGQTLDGILGHDFLGELVLEIDFRASTLRLSKRSPEVPEKSMSIPFELDRGIPRVSASIGSVPLRLRLDTGASLFETDDVYLNVTTRDWQALRAAQPDLQPHAQLSATGFGGPVELPVARVDRVRIGELEVGKALIIVQPEQGYFAREDAVGFMGNNLLEKHGPVTIDYPGRRLILTRR